MSRRPLLFVAAAAALAIVAWIDLTVAANMGVDISIPRHLLA